ncbi:MAG: hypothetical protein ACSHX4_01355 [Opitutaceae bacterium]
MLLSIVSVIKSPAEDFGKTYASVLQEFGNFKEVEYLIKEWGTDESLTESTASDPAAPLLQIRKISGRDRGVFDGMNQAIDAAKSDWILFLNAGDWLAEGFGACLYQALLQREECTYIYADGVTVDAADGREFLRKAPELLQLSHFLHHAPMLHPCLIVKRSLLIERPFKLKYDLAADYDLMVELVASGAKGYYLPSVAAFILSGGLSERARIRAKRQARQSLIQNAPSIAFKFKVYVAHLRFLCRHFLIVYVIRKLPVLRRFACQRSGGQPAGTYSKLISSSS